ncbi:glycosyl hydrolase family 28-related protein [Chryseobacterium limigenitum]|uniref:Pectate lyase superfamily protein n=1 Tax=Chryseobacterium limigenitum TaxID=1612149 RepID=A0A1K2IWC4_9FLAO|nr:glycosyl hydrolase family 28-related protein [Chryseobacterium limigenitum]SFZ96671.1 Pectate lyase superfamily protein [Chryseobacterium limigenitum]
MIYADDFFKPTNTLPLDPLVQLIDNETGENAFYVKCGTSTNLVDDGVIYRKSVNTFYKRQIDNGVNVKWFGAKGDGIIDDTYALKEAMQKVYNLSVPISPTLGWRNPMKLVIPAGKYKITANLLDTSMDSARFIFEGDGWQNTEIIYEPLNSNEFMFNNDKIIGFTTFEGIQFTSKNKGKFMNLVGGAPGNAQAIIFEKCFFEGFNQIISCNGLDMTSEVTFTDCKIKGGDTSAVYFNLANDQGVNWRFYGTDIEGFTGVLFDFIEGQTIYYYQGSIMPGEGGTVIRINSAANPDTFGGGTQPHISFWGPRFELLNGAKLIQVFNKSVNFVFKFDSCGMGGSTIKNGLPVIETKGKGTIIFDTCSNWYNYKISHDIDNGEDYLSPLRIIFRNIAPTLDQINQSVCNVVGNISSYPIYIFENCNTNSWYRPWKKAAQNSPYGWNISKHISGVNANSDGVYLPSVSLQTTVKINLNIPDQYITAKKIIFKKAADIGEYYDQVHHIKIYDKTETILLAEGDFDTNKGLILNDPRPPMLHTADNYVIYLTPTIFYGDTLLIGINLISEY